MEYPDNRRVRQSIPFVVTLSIREHQPRFRCTALRAHRVQQPPQQPNGASKPSPSRRCDPRLTLKGGINIRGGPRHGRQSNPQCLVPSCPIALARPTRGEARIMPAGTAARWRCACHCRPLVAGLLAHRRMRYNPIRPGLGHSAPGHAQRRTRLNVFAAPCTFRRQLVARLLLAVRKCRMDNRRIIKAKSNLKLVSPHRKSNSCTATQARWTYAAIDFDTTTMAVRRAKRGMPSTHPFRGDKSRALRKLTSRKWGFSLPPRGSPENLQGRIGASLFSAMFLLHNRAQRFQRTGVACWG